MAVFEAYLDESERQQGGVFVVAGLIFAKPKVRKFNAEWRHLFMRYGGCHMTDLGARRKQFKGISDSEAARLIRGAVELIDRYSAYGVAVGCKIDEISGILPKHIEGFGHAYVFLSHMAMFEMAEFVGSKHHDARIAYIFESGHQYESESHRFIANADPPRRASYRQFSAAWAPKDGMPALQAADILAWEYAKYWDEKVLNPSGRPMRKSLIAILTSRFTKVADFNKRYKVNFYTGPPLWCAMEAVKGLASNELWRRN